MPIIQTIALCSLGIPSAKKDGNANDVTSITCKVYERPRHITYVDKQIMISYTVHCNMFSSKANQILHLKTSAASNKHLNTKGDVSQIKTIYRTRVTLQEVFSGMQCFVTVLQYDFHGFMNINHQFMNISHKLR